MTNTLPSVTDDIDDDKPTDDDAPPLCTVCHAEPQLQVGSYCANCAYDLRHIDPDL